MVRIAILVMVLASGCATADDAPTSAVSHPKLIGAAAAISDDGGFATPEGPDVCTLAAQLPEGDLCAKVCDPDAMKAQLQDEGEPAGTCLEFNCEMPDSSHVIVGVCLPPN
jgi:hypothetical protein